MEDDSNSLVLDKHEDFIQMNEPHNDDGVAVSDSATTCLNPALKRVLGDECDSDNAIRQLKPRKRIRRRRRNHKKSTLSIDIDDMSSEEFYRFTFPKGPVVIEAELIDYDGKVMPKEWKVMPNDELIMSDSQSRTNSSSYYIDQVFQRIEDILSKSEFMKYVRMQMVDKPMNLDYEVSSSEGSMTSSTGDLSGSETTHDKERVDTALNAISFISETDEIPPSPSIHVIKFYLSYSVSDVFELADQINSGSNEDWFKLIEHCRQFEDFHLTSTECELVPQAVTAFRLLNEKNGEKSDFILAVIRSICTKSNVLLLQILAGHAVYDSFEKNEFLVKSSDYKFVARRFDLHDMVTLKLPSDVD